MAAGGGVGDDGGGIGEALCAGKAGHGGVEGGQLGGGHRLFRLVGAGEVGHVHNMRHLRALAQGLVGGGEVLREEAHAMHAGIHFQPNGYRLAPAVCQQAFELPLVLYARPQAVFVYRGVFGGLKHAFEHHDGRADAGLAQFDALIQRGHGETVGQIGQRTGAAHGTVAVGIGFHHGEHFVAVQAFEQLVVVAQVAKADGGGERAHDDSLLY